MLSHRNSDVFHPTLEEKTGLLDLENAGGSLMFHNFKELLKIILTKRDFSIFKS